MLLQHFLGQGGNAQPFAQQASSSLRQRCTVALGEVLKSGHIARREANRNPLALGILGWPTHLRHRDCIVTYGSQKCKLAHGSPPPSRVFKSPPTYRSAARSARSSTRASNSRVGGGGSSPSPPSSPPPAGAPESPRAELADRPLDERPA